MVTRIRTAAVSDVPAMHRIRMAVKENRLEDPSRVSEASYLPYVTAGSAWVAERESAILGFAILDEQANSVWALFVDHTSEAAGIGRALHDHMLEWARERGLRQLSLTTSAGTRAEGFYKAAGWTHVGVEVSGEVRLRKEVQS